MTADPHAELARLLEEERRLILSGAWANLQTLAPRKERCLLSLEPRDTDRLGSLAAGLARNQALLRAALDGLHDAMRRRAALVSARRGLVTYSASGTRAELPTAPPRFERKA
jgi:hypothetical protein